MWKFTLEEKLEIVKCYIEGKEVASSLGKEYGISKSQIYSWVKLFEESGIEGFRQKDCASYSPEFKLEVLEYRLKTKASYVETAYTFWFNGSPGVGKSHLAMSILHALNERAHKDKSYLFIDLDEMLRRIRASFDDKSSKYTEQYFISLLCDVEYLVLDDLGAEIGNIDTNKITSDFTSRVLRAVVNARQDKSTIITTNLSSEQLLKMYDPKLISRMMRHLETIIFKDMVDKRICNIGF